MPSRRCVSLLLLSLLALPTRAQDGRPDLLPEIVVEAPGEEEIVAFVGQVLPENRNRQLARWHNPLCVAMRGFSPTMAERFQQQIQSIAAIGGLEAPVSGCRPNVIIILIDDPDLLVDRMMKRYGYMFRPASTDDVRAALGEQHAVRIWYTTIKTGALNNGPQKQDEYGNPIVEQRRGPPENSRLGKIMRTDLLWAMVVMDRPALAGKSVESVASHVGMRLMGAFAADTQQATIPTILNLFQGERPQPVNLTDWDRALLRELYAAPVSGHIDPQRRQIARRLTDTAAAQP
ncbi:hypothetical protein CHU95_16630 [Niveispirillum lacus]|uniref:DUF2927 domain-containing protein n=1 Tax=Niveispirillum lacus TaxID=1981099 RepID=A0A255YT63_9PROT|nr:hypothetical protein [Niveispirillum lacus]OYQ32426.1 hypothetical protein CHU95_16630 [Niveispirillum lacus]